MKKDTVEGHSRRAMKKEMEKERGRTMEKANGEGQWRRAIAKGNEDGADDEEEDGDEEEDDEEEDRDGEGDGEGDGDDDGDDGNENGNRKKETENGNGKGQ